MAFNYDHRPHHSKSKLYVALELVTFGAVPLVSLNGRAETIQAALSYLLFALLGSILYLVGRALLYGAMGPSISSCSPTRYTRSPRPSSRPR